MWSRPQGSFEISRPMQGVDRNEVTPNPWIKSVIADTAVASWRDDPDRKRRFAQALQTSPTPFDAALAVFGADTGAALWASVHWLGDPLVQSVKEDVKATKKILDKDSLCHKLLNISEEKSPQGYYIIEPKDRIACLKLYAEIQGYIGKVEAATFNNFANNNLKVVFVKPDNDHHKIKTINSINNSSINKSPVDDNFVTEVIEPINNNFKPLPKLRMV